MFDTRSEYAYLFRAHEPRVLEVPNLLDTYGFIQLVLDLAAMDLNPWRRIIHNDPFFEK